MSGVFVPFPDRLITDLKICVRPECSDVRITVLQVTGNAVRATICANVNGNMRLLGYIRGGDNAGTTSLDPDYPLSGFMFVGQISDADAGTYSGEFKLDPSCVLPMPNTAYRRYTGAEINKQQFDGKHVLDLKATGLFDISSGATVTLRGEAEDAHFVLWDNEYEYTKVLTVNGCRGKTLKITTSGGVVVSAHTRQRQYYEVVSGGSSLTSGGICAVNTIFNGGSSFPHCYDDADESENN
jgi:hypothetical protein